MHKGHLSHRQTGKESVYKGIESWFFNARSCVEVNCFIYTVSGEAIQKNPHTTRMDLNANHGVSRQVHYQLSQRIQIVVYILVIFTYAFCDFLEGSWHLALPPTTLFTMSRCLSLAAAAQASCPDSIVYILKINYEPGV